LLQILLFSSYCKNNNKWSKYDDLDVKELNDTELDDLDFLPGTYLLFYTKQEKH